MNTKKHTGNPHLTGEYKYGDVGQLILLFIFLGIWISDSFVWHYSTFLMDVIPKYVRIGAAAAVLTGGWYLAQGGMKAVFGTQRSEPVVIDTGVFSLVRHPIYTGALLFYLGAILMRLSLASAVFWLLIFGFYFFIARYEERILTRAFGEDYICYKKKTGMLFPKFFR